MSENLPNKPLPKELPKDLGEELEQITSDQEIQQMLKKMLDIRSKCETLLEDVYQKGNLSTQKIEKRLNSLILSKSEELAIENKRKKLEQDLQDIFGEEIKLKHFESKDEKDLKTRKGKSRGARKNWIPMR